MWRLALSALALKCFMFVIIAAGTIFIFRSVAVAKMRVSSCIFSTVSSIIAIFCLPEASLL
jgi:hypothetical protein